MSQDVIELAGEPSPLPATKARPRAARTPTEIRALARGHTKAALKVLVGIMRNDEATPAVRLSAANAILDRGWGKAAQPIESGEEGVETVHRVERVIVRPDDAGGGGAGPKA
ncbi:hypothetical protein C7U92_21915 [Bradyrhizobium sp. WBOS7]|uniref:Uncharacterized protein n=1 Tax=Bradyrhizobium betae TaxID=244734 RepID=A0AAE9SW12_9BRAD|nr:MULTISPECIES: hypothetical protein [Bradyrhizobium]MDD1573523.1 hypothetical protein [Bradyrhizobium sp. WBOS1]UUO38229.1 hypothetical protein DCK84_29025 [Bradyrhizobium sp. WBOS01]MDD1530057.1 hypothetical protein [Bradyrhizobium sp. WBOS2]MDD1579354.1 hypothetical protein [Bradyrhizobium sp. WBOS7]MDD1602019.1 hypothetical protein [Bradyrhizobium sp. WBOS16]